MAAFSGNMQQILEYTAWRMDAPPMFGAFHVAAVLIAVIIAAAGAVRAKRLSAGGRFRLLETCGWVLVILEVYKQLFLYYEAIGEEMGPEAFMAPLSPLLSLWPEKENTVPWAKMYHIYWHCEPKDEADWRRDPKPLRRRGRIAYLKHETMFEYVYHHFAIVREGLLKGDRYMSIALHEDVLFSYFEEPRSSVNIRRVDGPESQTIQGWLDVNPEAHFIPLPGSNGQNFLLLPECFAVGQE